jgi:hypothetical protein
MEKTKTAILLVATFALAMLFLPPTVKALTLIDGVNIGEPTSEAGHDLVGWGPIEPATHGGGWGGGDDGTIRTTWAPSIEDNDPSASLTFDSTDWFGTTLKLKVLDGMANDDFEVYVGDTLVYSYTCDPSTTEYWVTHEIPVKVTGAVLVTIKATGPAWSGIDTWGQLGVSWAELWGFEQGYDSYGYNYQAHMFNGWYPNYARPDTPYEGTWKGDGETWLSMKWNDAWLSNMDRDADQELDRHYGYDSYIGSGAWLTNHQKGWYLGDDGKLHQWTYFVKIVAPDYVPTDGDGDGYDDASGAEIIWGSFLVIQSVYNDKYGGYHGVEVLVKPAGFGAY